MANEFTDTNITGTLTVNGVSVTAGITAGGLLALAVVAMRGATASDSGILAATGDNTGTELKVVAQGTPGMTVSTTKGTAIITGIFTGIGSSTTSATFVAPVTNPRIDIMQISTAGVVSIKAGTENASPSAPSVDAGNLKLAEIYHRVGETSIKNTDDSTNGYITDSRTAFI